MGEGTPKQWTQRNSATRTQVFALDFNAIADEVNINCVWSGGVHRRVHTVRFHPLNGWQRESRHFGEIARMDAGQGHGGAQLCRGYHGLNITCRVNNNALAITRIIMPMKINSSGLWIKTRHARKCDAGAQQTAGSPGYRRPKRHRAAANGLPRFSPSPARATRPPERSRSWRRIQPAVDLGRITG